MAEHGEIVAGATGIGALLGAFFGAWKLFKPGKGPEKEEANMQAWMQQVNETLADHSARLKHAEDARSEQREDLGKVFGELRGLNEGVARIEGALGLKGGGR